MEELAELRANIIAGDYQKALQIVDELEAMSVEDKLNKISSYMIILLLHLIKEDAEKRLTKSWKFSINNSVNQINKINQRRKSSGYYAKVEDLEEIIEESFNLALEAAAIEAFGGAYDEEELLTKINVEDVKQKALSLLKY